ncbi:MAG: exodeoxyribonuclease VII large subunit [Anaerolineales bacterium]
MAQPALFAPPTFSVTELTRRLRRLLEGDPALQDTWVRGEISNLARPASGHLYFTLKDSGAALKCVIWKSDALRLRSLPLRDGLSVEAHGKISIYEPGGQYQLYVDTLRLVGEGDLYAEFLRLKNALEAEGLFDPARKRDIPIFPQRIGIATSLTGAALRDMLNTLRRRQPLAEVILAGCAVQGEAAPLEIVAALQALNRHQPDLILVARGGGSLEDLWAFNDERVVRAIAASAAPVICGVGHETDFSLADFAADLRAPTPTAAAELASTITAEALAKVLEEARETLPAAIKTRLQAEKSALSGRVARLGFASPRRQLAIASQRLDDVQRRAARGIFQRLQLEKTRLRGTQQRLESLNPLAILRRGYAVVTDSLGKVIVSAKQAPAGSLLALRVAEGQFKARVEEPGGGV